MKLNKRNFLKLNLFSIPCFFLTKDLKTKSNFIMPKNDYTRQIEIDCLLKLKNESIEKYGFWDLENPDYFEFTDLEYKLIEFKTLFSDLVIEQLNEKQIIKLFGISPIENYSNKMKKDFEHLLNKGFKNVTYIIDIIKIGFTYIIFTSDKMHSQEIYCKVYFKKFPKDFYLVSLHKNYIYPDRLGLIDTSLFKDTYTVLNYSIEDNRYSNDFLFTYFEKIGFNLTDYLS